MKKRMFFVVAAFVAVLAASVTSCKSDEEKAADAIKDAIESMQ